MDLDTLAGSQSGWLWGDRMEQHEAESIPELDPNAAEPEHTSQPLQNAKRVHVRLTVS